MISENDANVEKMRDEKGLEQRTNPWKRGKEVFLHFIIFCSDLRVLHSLLNKLRIDELIICKPGTDSQSLASRR